MIGEQSEYESFRKAFVNLVKCSGPTFAETEPATGSIIPSPPPPITDPVYRPWTFEEVPLGAEVCWADSDTRVRVSEIIVGRRVCTRGLLTVNAGRHDYPAKFLLDSMRLCSINGGPWRRCGVEIQTAPPCQSP